MNKWLYALLASLFLIAFTVSGAYAQHRGYGHGYRAPGGGDGYRRNHNAAPYIFGGLALGIIGSAIIADQYYRRPVCRDELVDRVWDGNRLVPVYETVCR